MTTHSKCNISIDLFNLPPLLDQRNAMDSYLDVPFNFYIPDGKNSRLLQWTDRQEFEHRNLDGNEGFRSEIPYLECAFGTKFFIVDKVNGSMLAIHNDIVEDIDTEASTHPFDFENWTMLYVSSHRNIKALMFFFSVAGNIQQLVSVRDKSPKQRGPPMPTSEPQAQGMVDNTRLNYPSTPKDFNQFEHLKGLCHDGFILSTEMRSQLY